MFKLNGHQEPANTKVSDAEVAFIFIVACLDFGSTVSKAQDRLHGFNALSNTLDKGQLNRRLHALRDEILAVNQILMELKKKQPQNKVIPPILHLSQCVKTFKYHDLSY
jgi:hypothetical protein